MSNDITDSIMRDIALTLNGNTGYSTHLAEAIIDHALYDSYIREKLIVNLAEDLQRYILNNPEITERLKKEIVDKETEEWLK